MLKSLYGSCISEKRCIGYCHYHCVYLTSTQLKEKECLKKQCKKLEKYETHEYWRQRALIKERKRMSI